MTPIMDSKHLSEATYACLIEGCCGLCPLNKAGVNYPGCQTQLGKAIIDYVDKKEGHNEALLGFKNP